MPRQRVLFFSPYAGIWAHALPESYIAKSLGQDGCEVVRVGCDGTFAQHCTVMSSLAVGIEASAAEKAAVCRRCIGNAAILAKAYNQGGLVIADHLTDADYAEVDALVASVEPDKIQDLVHDGIEVGRIAAYEILIKFKKTSLVFADIEFQYLKTYVRNSLLSLFAFRKIFAAVKPDVLVVYSPQYGANGVCARYCELKGVPVYFIEGSSNIYERYSALRVWNWTRFGLTNPALAYWRDIDRYTLTDNDLARVRKHTECLLQANSFSVYSAPVSGRGGLRERFGVPRDKRLLLAAMSSYDEVFSAFVIGRFPRNKYVSDVFSDQLEWIRHTVDFVAGRSDLFLIIRIHPRTFPSQRNSVMAAEQRDLARLLEKLPGNVRVNYPEDRISIYDLYPEIDVLVTGWSATGVEAMTWGVPVVTYDRNLPSYPEAIHYTGGSRKEYEDNLLAAAVAGRSKQISHNADKWMTFSMSLGVVRHPAMFRYAELTSRFGIVRFVVRVLEKLVPGIIKRLEARRTLHSATDRQRLRKLVLQSGLSLYDD